MKNLQKATFDLLDSNRFNLKVNKIFNFLLIFLVLLSMTLLMVETVDQFSFLHPFFNKLDTLIYVLFSIEYLLRIWTVTINPMYQNKRLPRLLYALTPLALFDLFAILPFYIFLIDDLIVSYNLPIEAKLIRAIRFLWIFRILKLSRYNNSLSILKKVIQKKKEDLMISYVLLFLILYISSVLMYYIENAAQPDIFSSIPHAMWWGVATLTTIGYGDIVPITLVGKIISGLIAIVGIGFVGLPTGILASGFIEQYQQRKRAKIIICPHCQLEIPE